MVVRVSSAAELVRNSFVILQWQLFVRTKRLCLRFLRQKKISSCFHQLRNQSYLLQIKKSIWGGGRIWELSPDVVIYFDWVWGFSLELSGFYLLVFFAFSWDVCYEQQFLHPVLLCIDSYLGMDHLTFKGVYGWYVSMIFFILLMHRVFFSQNVCTCMIFFFMLHPFFGSLHDHEHAELHEFFGVQ